VPFRDILFGIDARAGVIDGAGVVNPLVFALEYCVALQWMRCGVRPAALIGHSLGEYAAATVAGVFTLETALELVWMRGVLVERMPPGAMLAVPLSEEEVRPYLSADVSLACVNGPTSCILAGLPDAIGAVEAALQQVGTASRHLRFAHAPHSGMMDPVLAEFGDCVRAAAPGPPQIPLISSLTGGWMTPEQATDAAYWTAHLRHTVRFADGLQCLFANPRQLLVEIGPGRSLTRLVKRQGATAFRREVIPTLRMPDENASDSELLACGLARCWTQGIAVDWAAYYENESRARVPLPTYPFERTSFTLASTPTTIAPTVDGVVRPPDSDGLEGAMPLVERVISEQLRVMSAQLDALQN
jgi:acyl transferase domain-containing protein